MPKEINGMKICSRKDCEHNGIPQPVSNFSKDKSTSDKLSRICKDCQKIKNKNWKKNNQDYGKTWYQKNKIRHNQKTQEWYLKNKENEVVKRKKYYLKNIIFFKNRGKFWNEKKSLYSSYFLKISKYKECRKDPTNLKLLQIKCFNSNCNKWFNPINSDIKKYLQSVSGVLHGTNELYCSDDCKKTCSAFGIKPKKSCEIRQEILQRELREMVFEIDKYTCQFCNKSINHFPELQLICHHIIPISQELMFASDVDNCLTLCKLCHEKIHNLPGCKLHELKQCAIEQRNKNKKLILKNKTS